MTLIFEIGIWGLKIYILFSRLLPQLHQNYTQLFSGIKKAVAHTG